MLKNILLSTIALLFISLVNCLDQTPSKTHTIYPRTGLAISCQIVSTSKDSIHFIPDYDTSSIYGLSMKQIFGYSFNKSHEERIDSTQVNKIEVPKSNIQIAGSSIKTAVTLGLIGSTLKAISPFLITTTEEKKSILVGIDICFFFFEGIVILNLFKKWGNWWSKELFESAKDRNGDGKISFMERTFPVMVAISSNGYLLR